MKTFTLLIPLLALALAKGEEEPSKLRGKDVQPPIDHMRKSSAPTKLVDVTDKDATFNVFAPENDPDFEDIFVKDDEEGDSSVEEEEEDGNGRSLYCYNYKNWYCYSCRYYYGYGYRRKCYYCRNCSGLCYGYYYYHC